MNNSAEHSRPPSTHPSPSARNTGRPSSTRPTTDRGTRARLLAWLGGIGLSLAAAAAAPAALLPHNYWPNPTFESGTALDQPDGLLADWNRGGNDPSICQVVTLAAPGSGHALAVIDLNEGDLYGEWYSDVALGAQASGGDTLNMRWSEMYQLSGGEMRLTVLFFNATDGVVGQSHFVTRGTTSPGWAGTPETSTFTPRAESLSVPVGAVKMRCSLVSGGSGTLTGVMLVDDLSVARVAAPNLLFGNFWINPSFELGSGLDLPTGSVANWNRGGNLASICQVITDNFASTGHALAVVDALAGDLYGEWYSDVPLAGNASPGDLLSLQWFEMYNLAATEMRLTVSFADASGKGLGETHFVTSGTTNAGWRGTIANSSFTKRNGSVLVPPGAARLRCSLVSGGPGSLTGVMVIDDLSVARVTPLVSGNFWPNSTFETGTALERVDGTPTHWNRGGSDTLIDQVTAAKSTSPTHALLVVDASPAGYGEWYSDLALAGHAVPGDLLDVQWAETYAITNGEMRVTVGFLSSTGGLLSENHFVASGNSPGWTGTLATSSFSKRFREVRIPAGAATIRVALASAGPLTTVGLLAIDDLTVALHPPTILAGNLLPNPTFEEGEQLDNPTGALPAGIWARGGSDGTIDRVDSGHAVSPSHALSLVDNNESGYGEWYGFLALPGLKAGDVLDVQWYQLHSVTNGSMRLTLALTDAANTPLESHDYNVTGQSPGWLGTVASSPFERQIRRLRLPEGTAKLRVNLASGGASIVTGTLLVDDLSVRPGQLNITSLGREGAAFQLTWDSVPGDVYSVQFANTLGLWESLVAGLTADSVSTSYSDATAPAGRSGFYRVVRE